MTTHSYHGSDDFSGTEAGARTPRRSVRSRVSSGHVVMVVAGVLGLLLSLSVLRRVDTTVPVMSVVHDITPGTRVQPQMFRTTRVHADARLLANLVAPTAMAGLKGSIVVSTLRAGDLL